MAQITSRIRRKYSNLKSSINHSLTEATAEMLDGITKIRSYAFYNCTSLSSVTIPNSVTFMGDSVFYNCTSLTSVTVKLSSPPSLGTDAFSNTNQSLVIYVPSGSVENYKAASGWATYASRIQAIPSE